LDDKTRIFVREVNVCRKPLEKPEYAKAIYHI